MSRKRKNQKYAPRPYESTGDNSDTFFALYMTVLNSPAFKDLSPRAVRLYLYCRAQVFAEKKHPIPDDPTTFTMNQSKWQGLYGLYSPGNKSAFYKDMSDLIYHGFVRCLSCGATTREKTVYQLSGKWQKYGTPGFEILPAEKTSAMLNKELKEATARSKEAPCNPDPEK